MNLMVRCVKTKPAQALDPTFLFYLASKNFSGLDHFQSNLIDFQCCRVLRMGPTMHVENFFLPMGRFRSLSSPFLVWDAHELHVNDLPIGVVMPMEGISCGSLPTWHGLYWACLSTKMGRLMNAPTQPWKSATQPPCHHAFHVSTTMYWWSCFEMLHPPWEWAKQGNDALGTRVIYRKRCSIPWWEKRWSLSFPFREKWH